MSQAAAALHVKVKVFPAMTAVVPVSYIVWPKSQTRVVVEM